MRLKPRIAIPVPTSSDFKYNDRCWPEYARAVERSGAEPVRIPVVNATPAEVADLVTGCQGVLLPGSPADVNPQKYGQDRSEATAPADLARENVDELLLQDAHNLYKPILGVCYGLQILNTWRGGTLLQNLLPLPVNHSAGPSVSVAHSITLRPSSILSSVLLPTGGGSKEESGKVMVNSSHHQAVGIPGDNLQVSARCCEDGIIEAVEGCMPTDMSRGHFVIGVQWHPERSFEVDPGSRELFQRLVMAAKEWQPRRISTSVA